MGVAASLALGVLLMLTHRLYARPFALRWAQARCLWCGADAADGPRLTVQEPFGATAWRACSERHGASLARLLSWADAHAIFLRAGILGTLLAFLVAALPAHLGRLGPISYADAVAFFRLGIGVTVLRLAFGHGAAAAAPLDTLRSPFPLHIQALIGSWSVLWLFRLVGLAWLVLALLHAGGRLGWL
jgi:hypothetical protein